MNPDDKITDLQLAKLRKNTDVGLWTGNALQELQERRAADEEEENVKKLLRRFVRYHDDDSDCAWTGEGYFDRLMHEGVAFLNREQILAMEGQKINDAVARKVMGWRWRKRTGTLWWDSRNTTVVPKFNPSTDWTDAMLAVETLREKRGWNTPSSMQEGYTARLGGVVAVRLACTVSDVDVWPLATPIDHARACLLIATENA